MRRGMFVQVVVVAVFCWIVLIGAPSGQVALAADRDLPNRSAGSSMEGWTPLADLIVFDGTEGSGAVPEAVRAAWIVDDFEDGNIDGWIDEGGGLCTASTSAIAASGAYSMRIDGACGHMLGRVLDITGSMPTGISVAMRSNTNSSFDTYIVFGDSLSGSGPGTNPGAINFYGTPGHWGVFNGTGLTCGTRNAAQWYDIDFVVDWSCKMYDVRVDGILQHSNVSFYHVGTDSFDRIHVYNFDSATARYDDIYFYTPGVSPLIFEDDFERGSTCRWSIALP